MAAEYHGTVFYITRYNSQGDATLDLRYWGRPVCTMQSEDVQVSAIVKSL